MALTVRPDDEVYQFDTVWLGPDEYTLPIQARYVAWGTWLACFLVATVVLIPLGGNGPAGVLGSLIWSLGLSVVLSRAVMLVVDHERPLRSLPALFSAEARAALGARRRAERALLVRPGKIRVRETPPKVLAMRERQRARAAAKVDRRKPAVSAELAVVEPVLVPDEPAWAPDVPVDEWYSEPTPAWSVPTDEDYPVAPVPPWSMPAGERYVAPSPAEPEVQEFVRAPDPEPARTQHATPIPTPVAARAAAPARARAAQASTRAAAQAPTRAAAQAPTRAAAHASTQAAAQATAAIRAAARPAAPVAAPAQAPAPGKTPAQGTDQGKTSAQGTAPGKIPAQGTAPGKTPVPGTAPGKVAVQGWTGNGAWPAPQARAAANAHAAAEAQAPAEDVEPVVVERVSPFRDDPQEPERGTYRGPVTVSPDEARPARPKHSRERDADPTAALEARILLPARKDR